MNKDTKCYRAEFAFDVDCDYWGKRKDGEAEGRPDFHDIHKQRYPIVKKIKDAARELGIKYIWHFYEPCVEITWYSEKVEAEKLYSYIEALLEEEGFSDLRRGENPDFADWYCESEREREFGGKRHALCSDFVELIEEYRDCIEDGKGVEAQVRRTIHTICNPLGINYWGEAWICFKQGIGSFLLRFFSLEKTRWICKNILRFQR
jgi:hypothetical protein